MKLHEADLAAHREIKREREDSERAETVFKQGLETEKEDLVKAIKELINSLEKRSRKVLKVDINIERDIENILILLNDTEEEIED